MPNDVSKNQVVVPGFVKERVFTSGSVQASGCLVLLCTDTGMMMRVPKIRVLSMILNNVLYRSRIIAPLSCAKKRPIPFTSMYVCVSDRTNRFLFAGFDYYFFQL